MTPLRNIKGKDGERIRLILGEDGNSHLLIMNEDDGKRKWQSTFWSNIPLELSKQIKKIQANSRHITDVSFAPGGRWYVCGKRWDGTGEYHRWGGCSEDVSDAIGEWSNEPRRLQIAFGKDDQTFLHLGSNSYWDAGFPEVDPDLAARMEERQEGREEAHFVRLFPFYDEKDSYYRNSFFVKDSEGTEWKGNLGLHLEEELERSEAVHDVALAGDGTWCVIHDSTFTLSTGIDETIDDQLSSFFKRQKQRREIRSQEIRKYNELELEPAVISDEAKAATEERQTEEAAGKELEREKLERREAEERELEEVRIFKKYNKLEQARMSDEAAIAAVQIEAEEREEAAGNQLERENREWREAEEREVDEMRNALIRNLTIGSRVTVLGCSRNEGDAVVKTHYTGVDKNCITVEHDDKSLFENIDPMNAKLFDRAKQEDAVSIKYADVLSKRRKWNQCEREHILASHAMNYGMFLWRGLRDDETGKGLFAKDPAAAMNKNEVFDNDAEHSQYIHLTKRPDIAISYSAAFSCGSAPWRIAQIDLSTLDVESIHDVSNGAGLNSEAAEFAKSHEIVLVHEHIPLRAVTVHTIKPDFSVPKHIIVEDPFARYMEKLKGDEKIWSNIRRWRREKLESILKTECASYPTPNNASQYSTHLLLMARLVSESAITNNDMSTMSKKILCHGALFNHDRVMIY